MATDPPTTPAGGDPQLGCRIAHIPVELLVQITRYISTDDLSNVRLTCKVVENRLFSFFSHEFFRKKQFMVYMNSLQTLIDIAKHKNLGPCLKHVIISTDRLMQANFGPTVTADRLHVLRIAEAGHFHLTSSGLLCDMLAEAFRNLPNLETVDIRDFSARSRTRDGRHASWTSYGSTTLVRETGFHITQGPRNQWPDQYPSKIFAAVLAALAAANARPPNIESVLRSRNWAVEDAAFFIPPHIESPVANVLQGLQKLHLCLYPVNQSTMNTNILDPGVFIKTFLSMTPNLNWLRLNFIHLSGPATAPPLLEWLARPADQGATGAAPSTDSDTSPIELKHLEQLDLGCVLLTPKLLIKLLAKFSPREVNLRRVNLKDEEHSLSDKVNVWEKVFAKLAGMPGISIKTIHLYHLTMTDKDGFNCRVRFAGQPHRRGVAADEQGMDVTYSDSSMAKHLELARKQIEVLWPVVPQGTATSSDSSSDSEQDEDDDEGDDEDGEEAEGGDGQSDEEMTT